MVKYILIKGVVKELNSMDEKVALNHEKEFNKKTLGQLIGKAKSIGMIEGSLLNRLQAFNNERKWVVHNSIFENGDQLYTDEGRAFVFSRLDNFVNEAINLHKLIAELMVEYSVSNGLNRQNIEEVALNNIRRLKGGA